MEATAEEVRAKVRERYSIAASRRGGCEDDGCCAIGYSPVELEGIPAESVLDLGSGAGIDVFLASRLVGPAGHATGIDMTPTMVARATTASVAHDIRNASFVLAPIEKLPLPDGHADVVLSNCVINLSPDKPAVFAEAFRILKPGGRLVISDVVQERDLGRIEDDCGCVGNAMVRGEYLETIRRAGFAEVRIVEDRPWRTGPSGIEASAVTLIARKPGREVKM